MDIVGLDWKKLGIFNRKRGGSSHFSVALYTYLSITSITLRGYRLFIEVNDSG